MYAFNSWGHQIITFYCNRLTTVQDIQDYASFIFLAHNIEKKTAMVWLRDGDKSLMTCLAVSTQYRRVTDGQTDRQTSCDSIVSAVYASHHNHCCRTRENSSE